MMSKNNNNNNNNNTDGNAISGRRNLKNSATDINQTTILMSRAIWQEEGAFLTPTDRQPDTLTSS